MPDTLKESVTRVDLVREGVTEGVPVADAHDVTLTEADAEGVDEAEETRDDVGGTETVPVALPPELLREARDDMLPLLEVLEHAETDDDAFVLMLLLRVVLKLLLCDVVRDEAADCEAASVAEADGLGVRVVDMESEPLTVSVPDKLLEIDGVALCEAIEGDAIADALSALLEDRDTDVEGVVEAHAVGVMLFDTDELMLGDADGDRDREGMKDRDGALLEDEQADVLTVMLRVLDTDWVRDAEGHAEDVRVREAQPLVLGETDDVRVREAQPLVLGETNDVRVREAQPLALSDSDDDVVCDAEPLALGHGEIVVLAETAVEAERMLGEDTALAVAERLGHDAEDDGLPVGVPV